MTLDYQPIATAAYVELGQVAYLRLPCGCEAKCVFEGRKVETGHIVYAWWPYREAGVRIGLYTPLAWLPLYNEREARVQ